MGGCFSARRRHCGLCYFHLNNEATPLIEPVVSRSLTWREADQVHTEERNEPPDAQLPSPLPEAWLEYLSIRLQSRLEILEVSRKRGCHGCDSIVRAIRSACEDDGVFLDLLSWKQDMAMTWTRPSDLGKGLSNLVINLTVNVSLRDAPDQHEDIEKDRYHRSWIFQIDVDQVDGQAIHVHDHPFAYRAPTSFNNTGSETSLKKISHWLLNCDSSHTCVSGPAARLPKRVLEVTSPLREDALCVRVVEDLDVQEKYICLSHRWGASTKSCQTTTESLTAHLRDIPWSLLPKTFQDAARVAVWLGIKYLWVDSLCIIQDSGDDWREQAAQMCDIYSGAYATLAAAWSFDSHLGLFRQSPSFSIRSSADTHSPGTPALSYLIHRAPEHTTWDVAGVVEMASELPLLSRAWVYQERLLSPRLVYFTRYEVAFECSGNSRDKLCECEHDAGGLWGGGSNGAGSVFGEYTNCRKLYHADGLLASNVDAIRKYWHQIVGEYSGLHISFTSDRLPALSGVARQYGSAHSAHLGRYVAGMWERCFPSELLWYCVSSKIQPRPTSYCGPTWSWVSVGNRAEYMTGCPRVYPDDLDFVNVSFRLDGHDPYASISEAVLDATGYLAPGTLTAVRSNLSAPARPHFQGASGSSRSFLYDYPLDEEGPHEVRFGSQIYCMKTGFVWGGNHVCILLRLKDLGKREFERIGLAKDVSRADLDDWFSSCHGKQSIKIV